jgi:transposase InsO family protein
LHRLTISHAENERAKTNPTKKDGVRQQSAAGLKSWLHLYNWHRPHASLGQSPPISRSGLEGNNLLSHHT